MKSEQTEQEKLVNRQWRYRRFMAQVSLASLVIMSLWAMLVLTFAINIPGFEKLTKLVEIVSDLAVAFASIVIAYMTNATWADIKKPEAN